MRRLLLLLLCLSLAGSSYAALTFDGTGDRITTTNVTGLPTAYPYAVTAVVTVATLDRFLLFCNASGTAYTYYIGGVGAIGAGNLATSVFLESTATIATNTLYFVAVAHASATSHRLFAYNYATRTVVVNETLATNYGAITAPTGACLLGDNLEGVLNGTLTWLGIYLTDLTIQNGDGLLALATLGPYAVATPSLLYTFNEMTGTTVYERRGTGNNGTMTNFPASPWQRIGLPGPNQGGW